MHIRSEEGGTIVAEVVFGQAYEGPPGCVHGGYVAASFDEVLGATQSLSGAPGMTGTLSIRYESPTPLQVPLRFEGRLVGTERRKIFTEGACYAGDRLTTAQGIFISMEPGQFLDLLAGRERAKPTSAGRGGRRRPLRGGAEEAVHRRRLGLECSPSPLTMACSAPGHSGALTFNSPATTRRARRRTARAAPCRRRPRRSG
ncbi:MAG: PaaI family thioesterase [Acidimicrobiales bacterium]